MGGTQIRVHCANNSCGAVVTSAYSVHYFERDPNVVVRRTFGGGDVHATVVVETSSPLLYSDSAAGRRATREIAGEMRMHCYWCQVASACITGHIGCVSKERARGFRDEARREGTYSCEQNTQ